LQVSMAGEYARWRETFVELFRRLKESGTLDADVDERLFGEGFATLSDHLVGKQRLDPSLDTEAIMREMVRPVLRPGP